MKFFLCVCCFVVFWHVKESSGVVVSSKDAAAGTSFRDPAARKGTGESARRACCFSGEGPDNNNVVEVECQATRLVIWVRVETHFYEGLDTSVRQGVRMQSGRGSHPLPGRRRGIGSNRDREKDHFRRNVYNYVSCIVLGRIGWLQVAWNG